MSKKIKIYCIGLIIREIVNPFYAGIVRGMEEYLNKNNLNYSLVLSDMIQKEESSEKYIDTFLERRVDGIATTSDKISLDYLKYLKKINLPIVFIGRYIDSPGIDVNYITIDDYKGAYLISEYLIKLGHKNIACVTASINAKNVLNRLAGYKSALKKYGMKICRENIVSGDELSTESGFEAAKKLLSYKNKPTAIFCSNDFSAFGVIDYCIKRGIKVPEDVSIAGFDDVSFSSLDFVSLTTVKQPINKMGKIAAEVLINKIETKSKETVKMVIKPETTIRKSTRAL